MISVLVKLVLYYIDILAFKMELQMWLKIW